MIEGSASGTVVAGTATLAEPWLVHTNHPLRSQDYTRTFEASGKTIFPNSLR